MSDKSYHEKLDEIQRDLAWVIQYLLKMNQPVQPPPYVPPPAYPRQCARCGISLSGVMGFVCGDPQCPTFPRVTSVTYGRKSDEGYNG